MSGLFLILVPILLADMVNPILFAGVVYGLGSRRWAVNTWIILISFSLSYFLAGLIIALGLEGFSQKYHIPEVFDYVLEFFVALLLFYFAWRMYRSGYQHPEKKLTGGKAMRAWDAWKMGFQINLIGLPFALPYLAAIDQILKADLHFITVICILFLYNAGYILPFAAMLGIRWLYQEQSQDIFDRINVWIDRVSEKYLPIIFAILGLLLIEDCVSYFLGYREYSFLSLNPGL
ncbi:MAG: GAP family protein [Waddliaceae bacterium]